MKKTNQLLMLNSFTLITLFIFGVVFLTPYLEHIYEIIVFYSLSITIALSMFFSFLTKPGLLKNTVFTENP